jgi:hypothetical protein
VGIIARGSGPTPRARKNLRSWQSRAMATADTPSSGDEVDGRVCPGRVRVPCVDLIQRNEANNPEAHSQARKAKRITFGLPCHSSISYRAKRSGSSCRLFGSILIVAILLILGAPHGCWSAISHASLAHFLRPQLRSNRAKARTLPLRNVRETLWFVLLLIGSRL